MPTSRTAARAARLGLGGLSRSRAAPHRSRALGSSSLSSAPSPAAPAPDTLTLPRPDDWHLHVRDGAGKLADVVPFSARQFGRAVIMPNLVPPVTTVALAEAYRARILDALAASAASRGSPPPAFEPLMALYLTDSTGEEEVEAAAAAPHVHGFKLYPAGATTNSAAGVTDVAGACAPALAAMERLGVPLMVHGEVTDASVDIFDREARFLSEVLAPVLERFPQLRVTVEHATTADAVKFVSEAGPRVGASVTPQHLLLSRNALFEGGLRPHHFCLPVLKRESHRRALVEAATGQLPSSARFFAGTDSAPHAAAAKEAPCGCAGCFSAPAALELYAQAFEAEGRIEHLAAFVAHNGADFYGYPRAGETVTLERAKWTVPERLAFGGEQEDPQGSAVPLWAGQTLDWRLKGP